MPGPDAGLDDFEALLASVGIPTSLTGAGGEQTLVPLGGDGGSGQGRRMKRFPLASNAVLELLPRPGALLIGSASCIWCYIGSAASIRLLPGAAAAYVAGMKC